MTTGQGYLVLARQVSCWYLVWSLGFPFGTVVSVGLRNPY
jgi:hypothetical protein